MKRTCLALLAALTLSAGSGCCLLDHCLGHQCGYGGGCQKGCEGCSYCGPHCGAAGCCNGDCSCPPGGCGPGGCGEQAGYPAGNYPAGNAGAPNYESAPGQYMPASRQQSRVRPVSHVEGESYGSGADGYADQAYQGYAGGDCGNGVGHASYVASCGACQQCGGPCGHCGNCSPWPNCRDGRAAVAAQLGGPAGPPCGQVTYPYYTTRGPRDFLKNHPPRIGPGPGAY